MPSLKQEAELIRSQSAADGLSPRESAAMRDVLQERLAKRNRRRLMPWAIGLATAAAAAAVLVVVLPWKSSEIDVLAGAACLTSAPGELSSKADCSETPRVSLRGAVVELGQGAAVTLEPQAIRMRHGTAAFAVSKRRKGEPRFVVAVSHGSVVVKGTQFRVTQTAASGEVTVSEGQIEFAWNDGSVDQVAAGERLVWPRVAAPPADPEVPPKTATEPTPLTKNRPAPPTDPEPADEQPIMVRLFQLRSQGRFDEAIALLRDASHDRELTASQRERFGFELGKLIMQVKGAEAACATWRSHQKTYPRGPHASEVAQQVADCAKLKP